MSAIILEDLRQRLAGHTQQPQTDAPGLTTGCAALDARLASQTGGLLHELQGDSYQDRAATIGVTLGLMARLLKERPGPLIWCQLREPERLHLHAPGLTAFGLDPARLIKLTLHKEQDLLWAMEEALDCASLAGVVGILWNERNYTFTASRRLALRAQETGVPAFLVRGHRANGTTAAHTRWQVSSGPSQTHPSPHTLFTPLSSPRWHVAHLKSRGAAPGTWHVEWNHETLCFNLASGLADRTGQPAAPESRPLQAVG